MHLNSCYIIYIVRRIRFRMHGIFDKTTQLNDWKTSSYVDRFDFISRLPHHLVEKKTRNNPVQTCPKFPYTFL